MARAGCGEIMFGLESVVPRTLERMEKHTPGLSPRAIGGILVAASEAGIGVHVNLIVGFPGETLGELEESVEFLARILRRLDGASFFLSPFMLLPGSAMARQPARFGLELVPSSGDIPAILAFRAGAEAGRRELEAALPNLELLLRRQLGWAELADPRTVTAVLELYGGSGHGLLMKGRAAGLDVGSRDVLTRPIKPCGPDVERTASTSSTSCLSREDREEAVG